MLRFVSLLFVIWTSASLIFAQELRNAAEAQRQTPLEISTTVANATVKFDRSELGLSTTASHFSTTPSGLNSDAAPAKTGDDNAAQQKARDDSTKVTLSPLQETTIISIVHKNSNGSVVVSAVPNSRAQAKASTESLLSRWNYNPYRSTTPRRRTPAGFFSITSPMPPATSTKKTSPAATRSPTTKSVISSTHKKTALLTMTMDSLAVKSSELLPVRADESQIQTTRSTAYRIIPQETTTPQSEQFSTWRSTSDSFVTIPTTATTSSTTTEKPSTTAATTTTTTTTESPTTTTAATTTTTTTTESPTTTATTTTEKPSTTAATTTTTTTERSTTTTTTTTTERPTTTTTTSTTTTTESPTTTTTTTTTTEKPTTTTERPTTTSTTTTTAATTERPSTTTNSATTTRQYKDSLDKFLHDLSNRVSSGNVETSSFYDRLNALLASSDIAIKPTTTESIRKKPNWWERDPGLQFSVLSAESADEDEDYVGHRPDHADIYNSQELPPPKGHPAFISSGSFMTRRPIRVSTRRPAIRPTTRRRPPFRTTTKRSSVRTTPKRRKTTRKPSTTTSPTTTTTDATTSATTSETTSATSSSTRRPAFERITTSRTTTTTTEPTEDPDETSSHVTSASTTEPDAFMPVTSAVLQPVHSEPENETDPSLEAELERPATNLHFLLSQTTTRPAFEFGTSAESEQVDFVVINIWNYAKGQLKLMGQQSIPSPFTTPAPLPSQISLSNGNFHPVWPPDLPQSVLNQIIVSLRAVNQSLNPLTTEAPTTLSPPPGGVGDPSLSGSFKPHHYTTPLPIKKIQQHYSAPPVTNSPSLAYHSTPAPVFVSPLAQLLSQTYGFVPAKQTPGTSYEGPPQAPSALHDDLSNAHGTAQRPHSSPTYPFSVPMNPIIAKNLTATLGGHVETVPITPATDDMKPTNYIQSVVPVPIPHETGDATVYGYNAPPLNAILPDYIVERFPSGRNSHEPRDNETSGNGELSRQFSSPVDSEQGSKQDTSAGSHLSYLSPYMQSDYDLRQQYGPSLVKPIEPQVPPSFYSILATRNYPEQVRSTTEFPGIQHNETQLKILATLKPAVEVIAETTTVPPTTLVPAKLTTKRPMTGQRKTLIALGLSMLPTFVMAVPALGRRRSLDDPLGRFLESYPILEAKYDALKYLGADGLRQMRGNGIPIRNCKSTVYQDESQLSRRALICPGRTVTDINIILLDDYA